MGFHFTDRVNAVNKENRHNVTSQERATAQDAYYRKLSLERGGRFVHDYLLARIWYVTQIFPITTDSMRQLDTTISWIIWRCEIFTVPLSRLQRGRDVGDETLKYMREN